MKKNNKVFSILPDEDYNKLSPPIGYVPGIYRGDYGFKYE